MMQVKYFIPGAVDDSHLVVPIDHKAPAASQIEQIRQMAAQSGAAFDALLSQSAEALALPFWRSSIKDVATIVEKLSRDDKKRGGVPLTPGQLHDVLRGLLVVPGYHELSRIVDAVAGTRFRIAKADTLRLTNPGKSGWRCAYLILADRSNGLLIEVQILTQELHLANEKSHHLYRQFRGSEAAHRDAIAAHAEAFTHAWSNHLANAGETEDSILAHVEKFWLHLDNHPALFSTFCPPQPNVIVMTPSRPGLGKLSAG